MFCSHFFFFFFNDTATTEIYTLSLHDALPILSMRASLIKLSIFAVVTFAATMVLYYTIGNIRPGTDYTTYRAAFSDVTGILAGDDVRVAGVQVGRVTSAKVEDGHALLTFQLQSDVKVTSAATARVRYKNLLGQRYV